MFEQYAKNFRKVQTFVSLYENVNLLVLPVKEFNSLLVLTVLPLASTEYITAKISLLMSNCSPAKEIDDDYKKYHMASDNKWLVYLYSISASSSSTSNSLSSSISSYSSYDTDSSASGIRTVPGFA